VTPADLPLLAAWFADAEFVRWWGGVPKSRDEVKRDYLGGETGDEIVHAYVVLRDAAPIGYIQAWSDEPSIGGIDVVLVPAAQGQGFGPDAVAALAAHWHAAGWTRITIDPSRRNHRAIRAFAKAGFVAETECDDPREGTLVLMTFAPTVRRPIGPAPCPTPTPSP
jgi:aminoglycoside 6'-N-acetyltransferase